MPQIDQSRNIPILPYSAVVGHDDLKLAMELAYLEPKIEGVLISGDRGSGKSTAVRAFSNLVYKRLPVTLPINATEDRVVGGWRIKDLMEGRPEPEPGLLEEANGTILYVDEVNLLDDHIVNLILDVASTGILVVQREGLNPEAKAISFTLVGTMNPEEGGLRPQLMDRFGLMVAVTTQAAERTQVLRNVLEFDRAKRSEERNIESEFLSLQRAQDTAHLRKLENAKRIVDAVEFGTAMIEACVAVAEAFKPEGHRSDYVMALAATGYAALQGAKQVENGHLYRVAPLALQHRIGGRTDGRGTWTSEQDEMLRKVLKLI